MSPFRRVASGFLLVLVMIPFLALSAAAPKGKTAPKPGAAPPPVEHKVTRGETLWSISQKHRTSVGAMIDYNHLPDHTVREGMVLRIPPKVVEAPPQPAPTRKKHVHVVKRGEDFWDIASHYEIKPSVLAKANPNVNPNRIHEDMELIIPADEEGDKTTRREEPAPRPETGTMIPHTVKDDETFYSIGRRYGVSMEAVAAANPTVRPERLAAGMKILVPSKNGAAAPKPKPAEPPAKTMASTPQGRGRSHTVKDDESIASIAKKYGVSETALLRENNLEEDDFIYIDDVLKIPSGGSSAVASQSPPAKSGASTTKPTAPAPQKKPAESPPASTAGSDGAFGSYIVSAGEDENTICEAFGISKQTLFSYNHLSATTRLKPGDEIAIPKVSKSRGR